MFIALLAAALSADPLPPPLRARISDPAVIRAAVKAATAGDATQPAGRRDTALSADPYRGFAAAMDEARVPSCLHPDAMKHQPPKIGPVYLGGILALPFLAAAIVRGKCN
jgi:hypothetical protein